MNGLVQSDASPENNSELSMSGQGPDLLPGYGWGQQLCLHQGPIRGWLPASPTPAAAHASAPLQRAERDGGKQEDGGGRSGVNLELCILGKIKSRSNRQESRQGVVAGEDGVGRWAPPTDDADPNFQRLLPPGTSQVFLLSFSLCCFTRPLMIDHFWGALLLAVGLWLTLFRTTTLHTDVDVTTLMESLLFWRLKCL